MATPRTLIRNAQIVHGYYVLGETIEDIHIATGLGRQNIGNIIRAFGIMSDDYNHVIAEWSARIIRTKEPQS